MTNCNEVPTPVTLQLNPEVTTTGAQDYTRAWRTVSQVLTSLQSSLFNLQSCVNSITGGTPATSVTAVGPSNVVGTGLDFARQDHVHAGVSDVGGATGSIAVGTGLTLTGNTLSASGGGGTLPSIVLVISPGAAAISATSPLASRDFNGILLYRTQVDLTNATQARIVAAFPSPNTIPPLPPVLTGEFSTNSGATWTPLDGGSGPNVVYGAGVVVSSWVTITGAALADVLLTVRTSGGDGTTVSPYGSIYIQVR